MSSRNESEKWIDIFRGRIPIKSILDLVFDTVIVIVSPLYCQVEPILLRAIIVVCDSKISSIFPKNCTIFCEGECWPRSSSRSHFIVASYPLSHEALEVATSKVEECVSQEVTSNITTPTTKHQRQMHIIWENIHSGLRDHRRLMQYPLTPEEAAVCEDEIMAPAACLLLRETRSISAIIAAIAIIQYRRSCSSILQTATSAAASMATALIAATTAILIGKSTASQQCNFKRHQLSYLCRHECMSSKQMSSGLLENRKQRNRTITYDTLRIYVPTYIRAVSSQRSISMARTFGFLLL